VVSCFSRDGKQLAYSWVTRSALGANRFEIRTMNLQGTGVPPSKKLFDNEDVTWIGTCDWSPDGKWIAISLRRKDRSAQITLVSVEDGSLRALKSVDWDAPSKLFFSPDGRYLAFDSPANQGDVLVLATDGSREIPALTEPSRDAVVGWSPDGKFLLVGSDRTGTMGLWALPFPNGAVQGPPALLKGDMPYSRNPKGGEMYSLGVTSSGRLYSALFNGGTQDVEQATFDFARGRFLSAPVQAGQKFVGRNRNPEWSPDGKYLAYLSDSARAIAIRSLATGAVRELPLTEDFGYVETFGWASDSRSFVLVGTNTKGRGGIFRVDALTGQPTLVLAPGDGEGGQLSLPLESLDGRFLYYDRIIRACSCVARMKADLVSGEKVELIRRTNLEAWNLSPDGLYIAAHSWDQSAASSSILLVPTNGGQIRELMRADQPLSVQMWAPDSQSIMVSKGDLPRLRATGAKAELWRAPVDGRQPSKLDGDLDPNISWMRVHPDGRQVALDTTRQGRGWEVWVLENFLPAPSAKGK
jgi:Tol biopolymer transport system component